MAIEDWTNGYDYDDRPPWGRCARCGEDDLYWSRTPNGWRLFNEDDEQHFCKPSADDFEVQE